MTWEVAVIVCVLMLCLTLAFVMRPIAPDASDDVKKLWDANEELVNRVVKIETDHKAVHKLVDETNKLMTSARLAKLTAPLR